MSIHSKGASIWVMKTVIWGQKQMLRYQDILLQLGMNKPDLTSASEEKWNAQNIVLQQFRITKHSFLVQRHAFFCAERGKKQFYTTTSYTFS